MRTLLTSVQQNILSQAYEHYYRMKVIYTDSKSQEDREFRDNVSRLQELGALQINNRTGSDDLFTLTKWGIDFVEINGLVPTGVITHNQQLRSRFIEIQQRIYAGDTDAEVEAKTVFGSEPPQLVSIISEIYIRNR